MGCPSIDVERQWRIIDRAKDTRINGNNGAGDRIEELLAELDRTLPEIALVDLADVPPKIGCAHNLHVEPGLMLSRFEPFRMDEADHAGKEPTHLVSQTPCISPLPAAGFRVKADFAHELGKMMAQLEITAVGALGLGGNSVKQQARNGAEGLTDRFTGLIDAGACHDEGEVPVGARPLGDMARIAMGKRGLDEMSREKGKFRRQRLTLSNIVGSIGSVALQRRRD